MGSFQISFLLQLLGMVCSRDTVEVRPVEDSMYQCSHVYPLGSPALLLNSLHHQWAWQVLFCFMSSQWLASFVTHTFHKVAVLYFTAFEANKQKPVLLLAWILSSVLLVSSTRDLFRESVLRKWPQQFKTLHLGFILGIDWCSGRI